jgi:hypothetical protein
MKTGIEEKAMKNYFRYLIVFSLLSVWANVSLAAMGEGILSGDDAQTANAEILLAEVAVFKSIREGITLSLVQCDIAGSCDPAASSAEVQQIIAALDLRIDGLTQRQQGSDDTAGLEDVLIAYVDEREGYSRFLEQLGFAPKEKKVVGEDIDEAELFGDEEEEKTETSEGQEQFDIFADEDEEL